MPKVMLRFPDKDKPCKGGWSWKTGRNRNLEERVKHLEHANANLKTKVIMLKAMLDVTLKNN